MALQPPADAEVIQSPFGTIWMWCPAKGIIVTMVKGVMSAQAGGKFDEILRRLAASVGQHEAFHDWEGMTEYDGQARVTVTNTALALRTSYERVHVLFRSRAVAMGVKLASAVLPNLVSHLDRASFEAALEASLKRRSKS